MKDLLYELTIQDENDEIMAISLVENPAIESDFVYFNKEQVRFAAVDNEQRMLIGAILVPDKKILRVDGEGNPYHVFFTKDTVKKLAQNYLMKKYVSNATLEHDSKIKGVTLVESWVKDGQFDKSNNYGLALPKGTWVGMFKIDDDKIWNDYVKTGKVKGFSIEGLFSHKLVEAAMVDNFLLEKEIAELSEVEAKKVLDKLKYLIKKDARYSKKKRIDIQDMEGVNPTISSSYPGQTADGYTSPAVIGGRRKMKQKIFK
jgi:Putative phage serine protease XkdF